MLRNRMLTAEEERLSEEQDVTAADVANISQFSKLNQRVDDITEELKSLKDQKEACDDAVMELELTDDDELVPYQRLSTFFHLPASKLVEILQEQQTTLDSQVEALEEEQAATNAQLNDLKTSLKAKFGGSINLER